MPDLLEVVKDLARNVLSYLKWDLGNRSYGDRPITDNKRNQPEFALLLNGLNQRDPVRVGRSRGRRG